MRLTLQSLTRKSIRWHLTALLAVALIASTATTALASAGASWSPDPSHTAISFSVNHFFTPVKGTFDDYDVKLDYDAEHPENSNIEAQIKVASVKTGNEMRDKHLLSADWFEVDKYPYITFKSTSVREVGKNQLIASGPLTIKGQTQVVELPITLLGNQMIPEQMQKMLGGSKQVASFQAATSIDRGAFGVGVGNWAATMVVGGEVDIEILLEAHNR